MSKSFPTFCPLGPAIVSADEIGDPHRLAIGLTIDGEVLAELEYQRTGLQGSGVG